MMLGNNFVEIFGFRILNRFLNHQIDGFFFWKKLIVISFRELANHTLVVIVQVRFLKKRENIKTMLKCF